jgi:hypothetical protein
MGFSRSFLRVFFTLALLSTPQIGAEHALSHAFEEQSRKDKQSPHSGQLVKNAPRMFNSAALSVLAILTSLCQVSDEVVRPPDCYHFNKLVADARSIFKLKLNSSQCFLLSALHTFPAVHGFWERWEDFAYWIPLCLPG